MDDLTHIPVGVTDPQELVTAINRAVQHLERQPRIEVREWVGPLFLPFRVGTSLLDPVWVGVTARTFPAGGPVTTAVSWVRANTDGEAGFASEISIDSMPGLTAGTEYMLQLVVIGRGQETI